ncbi:MAG: hypothetical protein KF824_09120 [Fimbriimonadaceae bacterium]|nr:MAG: hypothetical protein KF824_09120 [Fimbriimonadaceae bacterium]
MKLKFPLLISCLIVSSIGLVVAQNKTNISFKSKSGDFAIENISEQLFEGDPSTNSVDFEFSGNPLQGRSASQNLTFTSAKAEGKIRSEKNGKMYLLTATLSGGVTLNQNPKADESFTLKSQSLTITEAADRKSATVKIPSSLTITANGGGFPGNITAASGTVLLSGPPDKDRTLDKATLSGAVNANFTQTDSKKKKSLSNIQTVGLTMDQQGPSTLFQFGNKFTYTRTGVDEKGNPTKATFTGLGGNIVTPDITKASKGRPVSSANISGPVVMTFEGKNSDGEDVTITAKGDKATMDASGQILLTGNVSIVGSGLDYQSEGSAQTIFVVVNDDMKPIRYGARGNPAKVNIKPTKDGDGGK